MVDTTALVALVVAAVALFIALAQLTQQLVSTSYVIRKCDRIVTGDLTQGGTRQWHWRQFRFTVNYQTVLFTLPKALYGSLGISPTVQVDPPSGKIWDRAVKTRVQRSFAQACWVSLVQDLVAYGCLRPEDVCAREESADRIPDDLTVAPIRVDSMAILLHCVAISMQVFKYTPTTGEIILSGSAGSISSSAHPILGVLLHYSLFSNMPTIGEDLIRRHGRALCHSKGVWANGVYGRFQDRTYRPDMTLFSNLRDRQLPALRLTKWPKVGTADSIGGAACFMAFAHVDVYGTAPPSVVRPWTAHFAEIIVQAHLVELLRNYEKNESDPVLQRVAYAPSTCDAVIDIHGCSSPHLPGNQITSPFMYGNLKGIRVRGTKASLLLHYQGLWNVIQLVADKGWAVLATDKQDPSAYIPVSISWEMVRLADNCIREMWLTLEVEPSSPDRSQQSWIDHLVAKSIRPLADVGPPSWGYASIAVRDWPDTLSITFNNIHDSDQSDPSMPSPTPLDRHRLRLIAEFSILRAAYFTIMMRAAHSIGPGLEEDNNIETALAYMA